MVRATRRITSEDVSTQRWRRRVNCRPTVTEKRIDKTKTRRGGPFKSLAERIQFDEDETEQTMHAIEPPFSHFLRGNVPRVPVHYDDTN